MIEKEIKKLLAKEAFLYNRKVLCTSYYIKAYAQLCTQVFEKTWRDEQRRANYFEFIL